MMWCRYCFEERTPRVLTACGSRGLGIIDCPVCKEEKE